MYFIRNTFSYINNNILTNVHANKIRKNIHDQLNLNYKKLTYQKAKEILHKEINNIDIYGDNTHEKNAEHVFPQCLFKTNLKKAEMKSDIHNLYLCNSKLNSQRSNFKYVTHEDYVDKVGDNYVDTKGNKVEGKDMFLKQGYIMIINKRNRKFVPTLHSRGMISRSLAYFVIKYDVVDQLKEVIDINTLIEWNLKDPPTNEEYFKNIISYKYQKNYNPFIIDPDLMLYAFSDMYELTDDMLQKKKIALIDPMYSIDMLLKQINELEYDNKLLSIKNTRLNRKLIKIKENKKDDIEPS